MRTSTAPRSSGYLTELVLLLMLATLWGASYTFIRLGVESIPPVTFIAARTAIAAVVLLGVLHWRGIAMPTELPVWRRFLVQSCLNSVIPFTLIAWAEQSVDAGLATILNSSAPIFIFILTRCLARQQSATGRQFFGVISGMIGICLIVGVQALSGIGQQLIAQLALLRPQSAMQARRSSGEPSKDSIRCCPPRVRCFAARSSSFRSVSSRITPGHSRRPAARS